MEMLKPALAIFSMVASCKLPFGNPNFNFLLISVLPQSHREHRGKFHFKTLCALCLCGSYASFCFCKSCLTRGREYFFAEDFTRVTGLICQVRRGNATFFFFDFMKQRIFLAVSMGNARHDQDWKLL